MRTTTLAIKLSLLPLLLTGACLESSPREGSGSAGPGPAAGGKSWDVADGGYEEEFDRSHARDPSRFGGEGEMGMAAGGGDGGGDGGGGGPADADSAIGEPGMDGPDPRQGGGLEGGEVNDNELWDEYLSYVRDSQALVDSDPSIHWLDVSRRYFIQVTDSNGITVPNAQVRVSEGQRLLADGLTLSDGRLPFHPGAHGAADSDGPFDVEVTLGDLTATTTVDLNTLTTDAVLDGPAPRDPLYLDVAFIIDSTGSMGEEIARIQQTILDIAAQLKGSEFEPELRMGFVEYRDRGDEFVTHTVNLTSDIESFENAVAQLQAGGGGDFPEDMNAALERTMNRLEWREGRALRLTFVVADAPPHHYDDAQYSYDDAMLDAHAQGIKVFPVASGGSDGTAEFVLRQLAQFTMGRFVFITEGGGSSAGSGGSDYDVNEADFRVERLDSLIVRLVSEEMAAWTGR